MGAFDEECTEGSLPSTTSTPQARKAQSDDTPRSPPQHDEMRTGSSPRMPRETGRPLRLHLTDQDEGGIFLNDRDANEFGPLTEAQLKREWNLSTFDPRRPRRPVRVLPVEKVEERTIGFKRFRSAAMDNEYPIKFVEENPKQKGTPSYQRYSRHSQAKTLMEMIELSTTGRSAKERRDRRSSMVELHRTQIRICLA